jgi:predicted ATPase
MRLHTLGELTLEGNAFKGGKPLLLLSYLAVEGPKERRFLQELFYRDAKNPQNSLSNVLTRLHKTESSLIGSDDVNIWCEVDNDATELLAALDHKENARTVELYRGPFLAGVDPSAAGVELEEWIYATRESLGARVRQALLELAEDHAGVGEFAVGAELAQRAYLLPGAPKPEGEELERLFVLLTAGEHGEAYEVRKEARAFELELSLSVEDARAALQKDRASTTVEVRHNLPVQATRFIGRERELSEVSELLSNPDCRLLSLVGVGGVGKTRLALEAAQEQLEQGGFPDGVVFTPLEALTGAGSIPAVVAGVLGLTLSGQEDASSVVLRFLEGKRLLLVLDNFEHVLEGASFVHDLMSSCPQVKVLVTTRERLNLESEWVFEVEGLPFPAETATLERAGYFDAVQLFSERARQVQPGYSLTGEVLPAVMRICRLVDGMPLAIELASSWLRALPTIDIVKELEAGIDVLESPARDVPERHRSVRVVFDHSWALLRDGEREVFRRLSVFRGGFRREAAAMVACASMSVLARLVDASLLHMSPDGRYDLHPLLSAYTREKLTEHPEERAKAEERHGSYFLGLVRELEPNLWTLDRKEALRTFLGELANIRAAWNWAIENLRMDEIERTTPAMFDFFTFRLTEGLEYFGTTFEFFGGIAERLDESNPSHQGALGTVLVHQVFDARFTHRIPDYQRARSLATRGIELLESVGDYRALSRGFHALGETFMQGEFSQAKEYFQQALDISRKHGKASEICNALTGMAWVEKRLSELAEDEPSPQYSRFLQEALEELRALNHLPGVVYFLLERAYSVLYAPQRRLDEIKALFWEGNRLAEELGDQALVTMSLNELAEVSLELGEVDQAAAHLREAQRLTEETGLTSLEPHVQVRLGRVALARGDFRRARELLLPCLKSGMARKNVGLIMYAVEYLVELLVAEGNPGQAVTLLASIRPLDLAEQRLLADLEASLTPEEFATALERGQEKTLDDVMNELVAEF